MCISRTCLCNKHLIGGGNNKFDAFFFFSFTENFGDEEMFGMFRGRWGDGGLEVQKFLFYPFARKFCEQKVNLATPEEVNPMIGNTYIVYRTLDSTTLSLFVDVSNLSRNSWILKGRFCLTKIELQRK